MLRITALKNAKGAVRYFESALSRRNNHSKKETVLGRRTGNAAEQIGLLDDVTKDQFESITRNRNAATCEKLSP